MVCGAIVNLSGAAIDARKALGFATPAATLERTVATTS